jgi:hypothetical protein
MFHLSLSPVKRKKGYHCVLPIIPNQIRTRDKTSIKRERKGEKQIFHEQSAAIGGVFDYGVDRIHKTPSVYQQRRQTAFPAAPVARPDNADNEDKKRGVLARSKAELGRRNHAF